MRYTKVQPDEPSASLGIAPIILSKPAIMLARASVAEPCLTKLLILCPNVLLLSSHALRGGAGVGVGGRGWDDGTPCSLVW